MNHERKNACGAIKALYQRAGAVKQNDQHKQMLLEKAGSFVVRFSNYDVEHVLEKVLKNIEELIVNRKDEQQR